MKRLLFLSLLLIAAVSAWAVPPSPPVSLVGVESKVATATVATLPAAGTAGTLRQVTDGADATDCTVGGGATVVLCQDTGVAWTVVAAAGSGDVTGVGDCTDGACLDGSSDGGSYIRIYDGDSNYLQLEVEDVSADYTLSLPPTIGTATYVLQSDGDNTTSWMDIAGTYAPIASDITAVGGCASGACTADEILDNESISPTGGTWDLSAVTLTLPGITGTVDLGGAVLEIPNGTSGTTDATGEMYLDTDGDGGTNFNGEVIQVYTGAANKYLFPVALPLSASEDNYILKYDASSMTVDWEADDGAGAIAEQKDWAILDPDDDDTFLFKAQRAITVTDIHCIATGGGSITIDVQKCSATGGSCTTVDAAITCDADGAEDDGAFTNAAIDAGDWVYLDMGAVSGTVNHLAFSIYYTEDK